MTADIVWSTTKLPDAIVGVAYEASLAVTGAATALSAASVSSGALPASGNLALNADKVRITGTPKAADVGSYTLKVTLTDTAGAVQSGTLALLVRYATLEEIQNGTYPLAASISRAWPGSN